MAEFLFPKPFPDETIFSVLCRFHLLAGFSHFKNYTLPFLGVNTGRPNAEFPCFLPRIAEISGLDVNALAKDLTSIHYYEPFVSRNDYLEALKALTTGDTKSLQSQLGSIANRIAPGNYLKFCPECLRNDNDKYGVPYWHRVHQLIGVTACPRHSCHLVSQRRSKYRVQFPEQTCSAEDGISEECAISHLISEEFTDTTAPLTKTEMTPRYLHRLRELGLTTTRGHIRQKLLHSFLSEKFAALSKCSAAYKYLALQSKNECYPECLFYSPDSNHQPLKHFLLIHTLFDSWSAFAACECKSQCDASSESNKTDVHKTEPDWEAALHQLKQGVSMRSAASTFATTVSTLKIKAQQKGIAVDVRPKKIFRAEERAIWRKLFMGVKTHTVAAEYGVSVAAIEKILSKHPLLIPLRARIWYRADCKRHQANIEGYWTTHSTATRNEIKKNCSASYTWLYKHENDWLYKNLPEEIPRRLRYTH